MAYRRRDYWQDEGESMGLESLVLGNSRGNARAFGHGMRNPGRGTRFWEPDAGLQSRPFAGFPGGRDAWMKFKQTGELPLGTYLTPEARSHYFQRSGNDPRFTEGDAGALERLVGPQQDFYYRPGGIASQDYVDPSTYSSTEYAYNHPQGVPDQDFYYRNAPLQEQQPHVYEQPVTWSSPPPPIAPPPPPPGFFY